MVVIIGGKRYDTERANWVASYGNGYSVTDFEHYNEDLYVTKSGNWFLHGKGGPMTKYACAMGDMTTGGEKIVPLTKKEVIQWMEDHEEYEGLEHYFPDSIVDA